MEQKEVNSMEELQQRLKLQTIGLPNQTPFNNDEVLNTATQLWPSKMKRDARGKSQSAKENYEKKYCSQSTHYEPFSIL
jgi:hypothetical protein